MKKSNNFKSKHTFEQRHTEASRIKNKYPDRLPVICEGIKDTDCPNLDIKIKYLVPIDLTIGQFMYVIRKRLKLPAEKAIFMFINGNIYSHNTMIINAYDKEKDEDGFLYISYSFENVFG